ncbi:MAG: C40 family peptidase [Clostridia bacterium]|nr:C40 family peptidase [Clostridia bacterium]
MKTLNRITRFFVCFSIVFLIFISLVGCNNNANNGGVLQPPNVEENPPLEEEIPVIKNVITYVKSKVNGLNIRETPSTTSNVVGVINKNDMVVFKDTVGNWYKTLYKGKTAYLSASTSLTTLSTFDKADDKTEMVMELGASLLGTKYVYGATRLHNGKGVFLTGFSQSAFDCSSFTQYLFYYGADVLLNLTTRTQVLQGSSVKDIKNLKRGDLMFFTNAQRYNNVGTERIGHVAIYFGDNYILHTASDYAVIEPISTTRWKYLLQVKRHINV